MSINELTLSHIGIILSILILTYQIWKDKCSRDKETENNQKLLHEKVKENELTQAKIYLESILPKQNSLRLKLQTLRQCYVNHIKNLHLRWIVDTELKFDENQLDDIFHKKVDTEFRFYTDIYTEFRTALPEVKNLFPHCYTEYFNFVESLYPIYVYTGQGRLSGDIHKWTERHTSSVKLFDEFIEKTYNVDSTLKTVWKE